MRLSLTGINHETAPIAIREKVAIGGDALVQALEQLHGHAPEGIILSTCNRTEIYSLCEGEEDLHEAATGFFRDRLGISEDELDNYTYTACDAGAAEHLFRVASGLESLVVGEYEVLGQIRQALEKAENCGMVGLPLRRTFHSALRAGRRVREETDISKNALSVSSVAVELAADITGDLAKCRMLVIGAGEAGELVAKVARKSGVAGIVIASRTRERAQALASSLNGAAIDLGTLDAELQEASIVVTCAGAPHRILDVLKVESAMRGRKDRPMVVIDIAIPRNVAPEVSSVPGVFLYNIDHLTGITEANRKQRQQEICRAEEIIAEEISKFTNLWHEFETRQTVGALMSRAEHIRQAQLDKTLKKLPALSDEQLHDLEAMTRSIINRVLKAPVQYLKDNGNDHKAGIIKEIFDLNVENSG